MSQALFAGSIPEIIDIVKMFPKYNGTYVKERGRRHVPNNYLLTFFTEAVISLHDTVLVNHVKL